MFSKRTYRLVQNLLSATTENINVIENTKNNEIKKRVSLGFINMGCKRDIDAG